MDPKALRTLIERLQAGDEQALAEAYDCYSAALYRAARGLLGSDSLAEDAVHDVFLALVSKRERLGGVEHFSGYLFASLRHAAIKIAARRQREAEPPLSSEFAEAARPNLAHDDHEAIQWGLAQLPSAQREVLALKVFADLTLAEVAQALNISVNTAASRYRYALARLRQLLGETT